MALIALTFMFLILSAPTKIGAAQNRGEQDDGFQYHRDKVWEFLQNNPCNNRFMWKWAANRLCDDILKEFRNLPGEEQDVCAYAKSGECRLKDRTCVFAIPPRTYREFDDEGRVIYGPVQATDRTYYVPLKKCAEAVNGFEANVKSFKKERSQSGWVSRVKTYARKSLSSSSTKST